MVSDINIYIYWNRLTDADLVTPAEDALTTACLEVVNNSSIPDYHITDTEENPEVSTDDKQTFLSRFSEWRQSHNTYQDLTGSHICLSHDIGGGLAESADGFGSADDSFVLGRDCVAGDSNSSSAHFQNIVIQEVFHNFIDERAARYDLDHWNEHDTGTVDGVSNVTPMATSYVNKVSNDKEHAKHGHCSSNSDKTGYTQLPTSCAIRALDSTWHSQLPIDTTPGTWFNADRLTIDDPWQTYNFGETFPYPVVIAKPITYAGHQPAHARLRLSSRNGTGTSNTEFECKIEEWEYQNGVHYDETVGAFATTVGRVRNDDNSAEIETGLLDGVDEDWAQVTYHTDFELDPVVLAQSQSYNGSNPIVTRVRNVNTNDFDVRVQEEEANGGHINETIGWMAIGRGTGNLNGLTYEAGFKSGVDEHWTKINFENTYTDPVFLANIQTFYGSDPCNLRYRRLSESSVEVFVEEEQSVTDETGHIDELVGYFVIENPATA